MMSRAVRRWSAGIAGLGLVVSALSLTGVAPAAAAGCSGAVTGDVNGDGYAEVAVSSRPGAVHVFYGHPSGLQVNAKGKARDDQEFTQDTPGIPGTRSLHDDFGQSTAFGDYNGDGCADLAIGDPRDYGVSGTVTILYGSPGGLTTKGVTRLVARESFPSDWSAQNFGDRISSGDLNHDGRDDLIAGVPDAIDTGSDIGETALVVYTADAQGVWTSIAVAPEEDLGAPYNTSISSFAVGDFDGDGRSELAVTVGEIGVLTFAGDHVESFVADVVGEGGYELAAGDTDADGFDDLAFEIYPDNDEDGTSSVAVVFGAKTGLSAQGRREWSEQQLKLKTNRLGLVLALGPLDRGPTADLVIGASGTKVGSARDAGAVTVLFGDADGPSLDGRLTLTEATAGVPGSAEKQDLFGATVATAFVQGRSQASLIVGAPNETVGAKKGAGRIYTFLRGDGPRAEGSRALGLDSAGVKGRGRSNTQFGLALGGLNSLPDPWDE